MTRVMDVQAAQDRAGPMSAVETVWVTLGPTGWPDGEGWPARRDDQAEGTSIDVELLGDGFHLAGQVHMGRFDRLSSWLNIQSGFIRLLNAVQVGPGAAGFSEPGQRKDAVWIGVNQIVVLADRSPIQQVRPGAPIVLKERRTVSFVARGYELRGSVHLHADGSMASFLEADTSFLPVTDLAVRWLSDRAHVARFSFAMVNREQLLTVLDESESPAGSAEYPEVRSA